MSRTGWTLQDQVDELRNKLALKDRDHRAYFDSSEIAKKHNDEYIIHLRKECKKKRVQLAKSINEDEKVVGVAFLKRHRERLSLRRASAPQAISIMDQKVCEKAKLFNALKHKRQQKESEIKNLQMMYLRNVDLEHEGAAHQDKKYQQEIRKLENSLDKAKIKIDTAVKVQVNYKQILNSLEKESLAFPDRLRSLESAIVEQKMEMAELKEIHTDALAGKEMIKSKLTKFELKVFGAKIQRDKCLNATKKQAEKLKDLVEKTERRPLRSTLQTEDDSANDLRLQSRINCEALVKISEYEDSMHSIMDALSISDVEHILHRVTEQQNTSKHLEEQNKYLEKQIFAMKSQKMKLQKEFEDMKYSGERKPKRSYAIDGDITDQLGLVEDKLQTLLNLLKLKDTNAVMKALSGVEFQEYIESSLPDENVRIQVQEEENTYESNELDYDSQDNEETPTRQDIKNRGQQILEKKTDRRSRKRKN
ncbi:outer dynein arm-docking complex subunit 3-like [Saccoglossus kowalevskii]|uniref:Coiled-coil domain-containing protein 151-like n=1 Tax=Saccoglossus kowalevskii TaxID=10224 RepID=A0ABM0M676_SACKO|nr:PREDICTED: coiled-coil domain-containing protein 151-like [Saccoglossus kowalevskii]